MKIEKNVFFTPCEEGENRYYIDDFENTINPKNNYMSILSEYVNEGAKVLDLGCAQGRLGSLIKDKKCEIIGVELDVEAAEYAKKSQNYKKVLVGDMTDENSEIYKQIVEEGTFDFIIMADILEHVMEPTSVMLMYEKVLKTEGKMLISVPNFANIKVALQLLNNHISYSKVGILDNTHIKWYTKPSFIEWIEQINEVYDDINLDCKYIGSTQDRNEFTDELHDNHPELFKILSINKNFMSLQVLFVLTKKEKKEDVKELYSLLDEEEPDIVEILSSTLKGKTIPQQNTKLNEDEIEKYESVIADYRKNYENVEKMWKDALKSNEEVYSNWQESLKSNEQLYLNIESIQKSNDELYHNWKEALCSIDSLEQQLNEARHGWDECAKYWREAVEACDRKDEEKKLEIEKYKKRIAVQKNRVKEIYAQLDEMEAILNPIMQRDLALQKENNELRKKLDEHKNRKN